MRKNIIKAAVILLIIVFAMYIIGGIKGLFENQIVIKELGASTGVEESVFDDSDSADNGMASDSDQNGNSGSKDAKDSGKNSGKDADKESGKNNSNSGTSTSKPSGSGSSMDYEKFHALSPADQQAYMESFESTDAFFKWYNKAKKNYEDAHPSIEIGGGIVDLK